MRTLWVLNDTVEGNQPIILQPEKKAPGIYVGDNKPGCKAGFVPFKGLTTPTQSFKRASIKYQDGQYILIDEQPHDNCGVIAKISVWAGQDGTVNWYGAHKKSFPCPLRGAFITGLCPKCKIPFNWGNAGALVRHPQAGDVQEWDPFPSLNVILLASGTYFGPDPEHTLRSDHALWLKDGATFQVERTGRILYGTPRIIRYECVGERLRRYTTYDY